MKDSDIYSVLRLIFNQWKFWKSFSTASRECADSLSSPRLSTLTGKYRGLNLGLDVNTVFYFFWPKWIQSSSRHVKLWFLKSQWNNTYFQTNHHSFLQFHRTAGRLFCQLEELGINSDHRTSCLQYGCTTRCLHVKSLKGEQQNHGCKWLPKEHLDINTEGAHRLISHKAQTSQQMKLKITLLA